MARKLIRAEIVIIGGGPAGLAAAIYLSRSLRDTLLIDAGKSMARWEPDVQNYLGFPRGIGGPELLKLGRSQAKRYGARLAGDRITKARARGLRFLLTGEKASYSAQRLLLATGIFHLPPDIPGASACLGHSLFFCKDCDGFRVKGRKVAVYGWTNEAADYALGMLLYSPSVFLLTDGRAPRWDQRRETWIREHRIPCFRKSILKVRRSHQQILGLDFAAGGGLAVDALFTTRGDLYFNHLARQLGAAVNPTGEIVVDAEMRTSIPGLYAAGCVTPANCQMIIAAGQGASAAQAINHELLGEHLANNTLRRLRFRQLRSQPAAD